MVQARKIPSDYAWPQLPGGWPSLMTPTEAAMYLRLHENGHSPRSARRTLDYWRDRGELKATIYARHIWFLKDELDAFLRRKTEAR